MDLSTVIPRFLVLADRVDRARGGGRVARGYYFYYVRGVERPREAEVDR